METVLDFSRLFFLGLFYAAPILIVVIVVIAILGHIVGKKEGWTKSDALYYAFITATTVGYGDFHPKKRLSKTLAIVIALVGIIFAGLVVAVGVHASMHSRQPTISAMCLNKPNSNIC